MIKSRLPRIPKPKLWQQALAGIRILTTAPNKNAVFKGYNRLRQEYILEALRHHFKKRTDDPAPLLNLSLLDIGCGDCPINGFMALSGAEVTSVDTCKEALNFASLQATKMGTPVNFIHDKVENLITENQKYDIILCLDVIEYINDPDKFVWSIHNLMKKNSILIFSGINRTWKAWFLHIFLSAWVFKRTAVGSRKYKYFYKPLQMRQLLGIHGITVQTVQGLAFDSKAKHWNLTHAPDTRYLGTAILS